MRSILAAVLTLALLAGAAPSEAGIGISPRLALPVGDFADMVGSGFGASVVLGKEVKGKPGRAGLTFLAFGEGETEGVATKASAIGAFAGYRHNFGGADMQLYGKLDTGLYIITSTAEASGAGMTIKLETTDTKIKATPGIGMQMGNIAAEIDYDLAGDWATVNLYYMLGNVGQ